MATSALLLLASLLHPSFYSLQLTSVGFTTKDLDLESTLNHFSSILVYIVNQEIGPNALKVYQFAPMLFDNLII
jgi:hypothetical protein